MKKALALVLALVMAFSMSAMAFADDTTPSTSIVYVEKEPTKNCPICGNPFVDADAYNEHIKICDVKADGSETMMNDFTIKEILNMIVDLLKASMEVTKTSIGQAGVIQAIVVRLVEYVEKITELGVAAVSEAEVKGAVADLETALADIKLPKVNDLLNSLKQKIKDLYAGEVATTVEETTAAEESVDTGSSSVGIALFAAVSVAAAAAYVCTKKSK